MKSNSELVTLTPISKFQLCTHVIINLKSRVYQFQKGKGGWERRWEERGGGLGHNVEGQEAGKWNQDSVCKLVQFKYVNRVYNFCPESHYDSLPQNLWALC